MTEMNRFMTKKVVTKINMMKRRLSHGRLSSIGCKSGLLYESMAWNMMSGHVSRVLTSKKVLIDANTVS